MERECDLEGGSWEKRAACTIYRLSVSKIKLNKWKKY